MKFRGFFLALVWGCAAEQAVVESPAAVPEAAAPAAQQGEANGTRNDGLSVTLKVPLLSEDFASTPIARIEDDVVRFGELADVFIATRGGHGRSVAAEHVSIDDVLDRLLTVYLIAAEATTMCNLFTPARCKI